ncbi:hypothetical protein KIP74_24890, partial [Pseudomonas aeruginosa]|nr:hypothetical protein [Pseudomonas aeruginosa]
PSSTPGERQARFQTLAEAPNLLGRENGLRLTLSAPRKGSIKPGNLVTYRQILPSSTPGERQARFQTLAEAPNLLGRENGLRLTLSAPRKGSIKPGNLVTYRQIRPPSRGRPSPCSIRPMTNGWSGRRRFL